MPRRLYRSHVWVTPSTSPLFSKSFYQSSTRFSFLLTLHTYKLVQYNALRVSLHLTTFQTQFCPELVLVSAGFDGARDDPLGGCLLTSVGYAHMTHELCAFAGGRVVLALEGGYNLQSTSECFRACVSQLLGDPAPLPPDNPIPNDRCFFENSLFADYLLFYLKISIIY